MIIVAVLALGWAMITVDAIHRGGVTTETVIVDERETTRVEYSDWVLAGILIEMIGVGSGAIALLT